jgi:hypothetical protein
MMIIAAVARLIKPPDNISSSKSEAEIEAAEEVRLPISLQARLDRAITTL